MAFKFDIDEKYEEVINLQITQFKDRPDVYLNLSKVEYRLFKNFIEKPKNILDLGCGLGRMSIYLNTRLRNPSAHFILADASHVSEKIRYGFNKGESYYNDLDLTASFARENGLTNFETFDIRVKDLKSLSNIDFVMSFFAVGFHSKIEDCLDDLLQITTSDCTMIFGVRGGRYFKTSFKEHFNEVFLVENRFHADGKKTKEDILILKGKK